MEFSLSGGTATPNIPQMKLFRRIILVTELVPVAKGTLEFPFSWAKTKWPCSQIRDNSRSMNLGAKYHMWSVCARTARKLGLIAALARTRPIWFYTIPQTHVWNGRAIIVSDLGRAHIGHANFISVSWENVLCTIEIPLGIKRHENANVEDSWRSHRN